MTEHNTAQQHAEAFAWNRASWDQRTPVHWHSRLYTGMADTLRRGGHPLSPHQQQGVGDVAGQSLVHLQCHLGMQTLGFARLGAEAVGLDFCQPSIDQASALRDELGIAADRARFVCANVYDAPQALGRAFDVVFVSEGSLCWLPDIRAWGRVVGALLRPGGRLFVHDFHPMLHMLDESNEPQGFRLAHGYLGEDRVEFESDCTYTESDRPMEMRKTAEWVHPIGAMLSGLIDAGLVIDRFDEHGDCAYQALPGMVPVPAPVLAEDNRWTFPAPWAGKLPCEFTLWASKR
ncbi:MAG: class I SAM-dependent methyltransferase [Planctomycetota bacterium]